MRFLAGITFSFVWGGGGGVSEMLVLVARQGFYGLVRARWIGGCGCVWDRGRSWEGGAGRGVEVLPLLHKSEDQLVSAEKETEKRS